MNQAEFMRNYNDSHREHFEPQLFERNNEDLVNSIYQVLKSCERDKYYTLKLLEFEPIYDYEKIYDVLREHEEKRKKKNSHVENSYDFINIKDTDMILCRCLWLVRHNGIERQEINRKIIEVVNPEEKLEVLIALPRFVNKYYFKLAGNYYTSTFQIVDGSTYNNSTSSQSKVDTVTLKVMFMPLIIFRSFKDLVDVHSKQVIKCIEYNAIIFSISTNAMYYLLAHFGLYGTCHFLGIDCIYVTNTPMLDYSTYYSFEKNGIYISVPKICMEDPMVQSLVATLYSGINKEATVADLFDTRYWLKNLGKAFKNESIDKGLFLLDSVDGIYDNITKRDLKLPEEDKRDIYCIIRWLLREFSNLRIKENTDVSTKRIRIADYISALYAMRLNTSIHRISDLGRRVTLKKVIQAVYTAPMYVLKKLSSANMSNLVSYRDLVNDNDAMIALKYTYKGISGLGEGGGSVQPIYRYVDPTHVGILDLDASTTSDPGMSGMICPMVKLYDNSFSEYEEPNTWAEQYEHLQQDFKDPNSVIPVEFDHDTRQETMNQYYDLRDQIVQEELEFNKVVCPILDIKDPTGVLYTCCSQKIDDISQESNEGFSLFKLRDNPDLNLDNI